MIYHHNHRLHNQTALLQTIDARLRGLPTTMVEDAAILHGAPSNGGRANILVGGSEGGGGGGGGGGGTFRMRSIIALRAEMKVRSKGKVFMGHAAVSCCESARIGFLHNLIIS